MTVLISVVVPTYQRNAALAACLDRLAPGAQALPASSYEVIVTDDAQDSDCRAMVLGRYPWATWVAGPMKGPAANRNHAARYAKGDWIAFVDDDCLPEREWLSAFADAVASRPAVSVFEGRTCADRSRHSLDEGAPINETGGCLWSCNLLISRALFQGMHGFDERFPFAAMEDMDFRRRLGRIGEAACFVREAVVIHPYRKLNAWDTFHKGSKSLRIYLSLHPEERVHHRRMFYAKAVVSIIFREILIEGARFRWRGVGYSFARAGMYAWWAIRGIR